MARCSAIQAQVMVVSCHLLLTQASVTFCSVVHWFPISNRKSEISNILILLLHLVHPTLPTRHTRQTIAADRATTLPRMVRKTPHPKERNRMASNATTTEPAAAATEAPVGRSSMLPSDPSSEALAKEEARIKSQVALVRSHGLTRSRSHALPIAARPPRSPRAPVQNSVASGSPADPRQPVTRYASLITLLHPASTPSKGYEIPGAPVALCYGILRFKSENNAQLRISENALPFTQYDEIPPSLFLRHRAHLTLSPLLPSTHLRKWKVAKAYSRLGKATKMHARFKFKPGFNLELPSTGRAFLCPIIPMPTPTKFYVSRFTPDTLIKPQLTKTGHPVIKVIQGYKRLSKARQASAKNRSSSLDIKPSTAPVGRGRSQSEPSPVLFVRRRAQINPHPVLIRSHDLTRSRSHALTRSRSHALPIAAHSPRSPFPPVQKPGTSRSVTDLVALLQVITGFHALERIKNSRCNAHKPVKIFSNHPRAILQWAGKGNAPQGQAVRPSALRHPGRQSKFKMQNSKF
jgi:hypothetical protein